MRPTLSWNVPIRGCCAQTHPVPRVQTGPNPFPKKACPTSLAPCLIPLGHKQLKTTSTTSLGPIIKLNTNLHALQSFVQCHNRSLRCSSHSSSRVLFLPNMLSLRHGNPLHYLLPPSSSKVSSPFDFQLASLGTHVHSLQGKLSPNHNGSELALTEVLSHDSESYQQVHNIALHVRRLQSQDPGAELMQFAATW